VNGAELVQLTEAARAFGDSDEAMTGDGWHPPTDGNVDLAGDGASAWPPPTSPEPVVSPDGWSLPNRALAAIAEREGWPLDLTDAPPRSPVPDQLSRYVSETLAAHAAVVMAKTQATAARAEAQSASRKVKEAAGDLDAARIERERAEAMLAEARALAAELDKQRAVAEARTEEIRSQLQHERSQRNHLNQRIGALEAERDRLLSVLGWGARRRLQRS
jgi:hypothetical protein